MAGTETVELIRLEGPGNSVVLSLYGGPGGGTTGGGSALQGVITVDTPFVSGSTPVHLRPEDVEEWQDALDLLDAGGDIAWRKGGRGPELHVELDPEGDPERAQVSVSDLAGALTTVTVGVTIDDAWFDDAYERLEEVREVWPSVGAEPAVAD
ncbi:DUF5959 family protein [Phaeacidiphilus oryzae]|jgi:hypothetical protein|uniref:DUF5959 family protein n=1 Tax=Phaeacidiphilus oryzae TaxID=348818 RepID=UPI00055AFB61|nr:DUF5959 family protein [Phaeacidiphilus oryzae]